MEWLLQFYLLIFVMQILCQLLLCKLSGPILCLISWDKRLKCVGFKACEYLFFCKPISPLFSTVYHTLLQLSLSSSYFSFNQTLQYCVRCFLMFINSLNWFLIIYIWFYCWVSWFAAYPQLPVFVGIGKIFLELKNRLRLAAHHN